MTLTPHSEPAKPFRVGDDINDLSAESIIIFDLGGTISYWSGPAQGLYGWTAEAAIGEKIDAMLSPPAFEPHPLAHERLRADGAWSGKLLRVRADGEQFVVKVRWTLRLDADGEPDAIVEFSRAEATEQNFDKLKASEARYRQLFHRAPIALMLDDARGIAKLMRELRIVGVSDLDSYIDEHPEFIDRAIDTIAVLDANARALDLFGAHELADLLGPVRHIWRDTPGTFRRAFVALYQGASYFAEETKVRTLDGRTVDVLFTLAFSAQDEFLGASLNGMLDISARVQAEAQLRKVNADFIHAARLATLGELASSIAHEIKQPLSAILTNAQASIRWLDRTDTDMAKLRQLAGRIAESAERAGSIIARIQDMGGKRDTPRGPVDLNAVVQEGLRFIQHESRDRAVMINAQLASDLPAVFGDKIQLQQIIVNLLVNSLQAIGQAPGSQPEIHLRTYRADDGRVGFSIRDSGPGILPEHLDRVFSGFFTTKTEGIGMGLAICQSIIDAHGGDIAVTNTPEGGACFDFTLPINVRGARSH